MATSKKTTKKHKYIATGDTPQDFVVYVPQFLEAIEIGWLDGFLRQFAEAAHNRYVAMKEEEELNGSPDGKPDVIDGIYYIPEENAYFRVRNNRTGTKRYAELAEVKADGITYEYEKGKIYMLSRRKNAMVGLAGAREFVAETGLCLRCGLKATIASYHDKDPEHGICVQQFAKVTWEANNEVPGEEDEDEDGF